MKRKSVIPGIHNNPTTFVDKISKGMHKEFSNHLPHMHKDSLIFNPDPLHKIDVTDSFLESPHYGELSTEIATHLMVNRQAEDTRPPNLNT